MNYITKIRLAGLFLMVCLTGVNAQITRHDSINVQIDNLLEVHMVIKNPKGLDTLFVKDFREFQELLKDSGNIPGQGSYSLQYHPGKSLTVGGNSEYKHIVWEEKGKKHFQFNNQVSIFADTYTFQVLFNDIQNIRSNILPDKLQPILDSLAHKKGRGTAINSFSLKGEKLVLDYKDTKGASDYLYINGGAGAGMIGSQLYTDLKGELGIGLSKYGYVRTCFYTSYVVSFFGTSKLYSNEMVNLGIRYNISQNIYKPSYLGVEVGYMTHHEGDLLGKNAFKFGVNWELGKMITVSPEIYYYDKFNVGVPGIRIGIGF